jgi:hypothetical protein
MPWQVGPEQVMGMVPKNYLAHKVDLIGLNASSCFDT